MTLVVDRDVRPERPDEEEAPQMLDEAWELAKRCWGKDPQSRPKIDAIRHTMSRLLEAHNTGPTLEVNNAFSHSFITDHVIFLPDAYALIRLVWGAAVCRFTGCSIGECQLKVSRAISLSD
jgi:hypothetical protein